MRTLSIDIETYSSTSLKEAGVYRYTQDPLFEIILFAYAVDDGPPQVVDLLSGEQLPDEILHALTDPGVTKTAWNANFERVCIAAHMGIECPPEQWRCTMVRAGYNGLPLSLDLCAKVLGAELKDSAGSSLIRFFCQPRKPTLKDNRNRNMPADAPDRWEAFKNYCLKDVIAERSIASMLAFELPDSEQEMWEVDQHMNDRGVRVDMGLVEGVMAIHEAHTEALTKDARRITGLDNPNSIAQLKDWVEKASGETLSGLTAPVVEELLQTAEGELKEVLLARQQLAKTSIKKYTAIVNSVCEDGRVRGMFQFYGASRTGRWSGRIVQLQNLPRINMHDSDLATARKIALTGDSEAMELVFGNVSDVLSQLIRTAFIASEGNRLLVSDFSAIEARVLAWLAGERWRIDVFKSHGKIYEASASQMFRVPIESITKESDLRQKGKVSELALGYGGGPGALISMGALKMGIEEEELPRLVKMWRNANPAIVNYWWELNDAALAAIRTGYARVRNISFRYVKGDLVITLPSNRQLVYHKAGLIRGHMGDRIYYYGMDQVRKVWSKQETYGGKLAENITQAVASDLLRHAMLLLHKAGYPLVMTVHDEVVCDYSKGSIEELTELMSRKPAWAKGLPLKADSYETFYYKK